MKKIKLLFIGIVTGVINGLLGAGGGMLIVPILEKLGLDEKQSHSTSIAIILPLSMISSYIYFVNGNLDLQKALFLIPFGIVGAIIGGFILPHFNSKLLKKIFGVMLLYFSFRMLLF